MPKRARAAEAALACFTTRHAIRVGLLTLTREKDVNESFENATVGARRRGYRRGAWRRSRIGEYDTGRKLRPGALHQHFGAVQHAASRVRDRPFRIYGDGVLRLGQRQPLYEGSDDRQRHRQYAQPSL